jgi:nucleoside-diphosphate-sugar epimerase
MAQALGKPSRLFPFPPRVFTTASELAGKTHFSERLYGSLQLDITRTKHLLKWMPPVSVQEGISRCFPKT